MPGIMKEFPGVLPWHFGGEEYFTYREARNLVDLYQDICKEREKEAREAQKANRQQRR